MIGSDFEEDFIMRQIKNIIQSVARIAFGADVTLQRRMEQEACDLSARLTEMAAGGDLNGAENQLSAAAENREPAVLAAGLQFYDYLNSLDDDYLAAHDYSREEIYAGLLQLTRTYDMEGVAALYAEDEDTPEASD